MERDEMGWHGMGRGGTEKARDGKHSPAMPACRAQLQVDVNLSQLPGHALRQPGEGSTGRVHAICCSTTGL